MSDYLWNGAGEPDPEVVALESRLSALRSTPRPLPRLPEQPPVRRPAARRLLVAVPLALAALLLLAAGGALFLTREGWRVAWTDGRGGPSRLLRGDVLETGVRRARLSVGRIGELGLEPGTRVRLLDVSRDDHRIELTKGTIHALIWAPPRRFFVETPTATAVDLGCAYTLSVDEAGNGLLTVTAGWVSFERRGEAGLDEVAVPAGASCRLRAGEGPGTPAFADASASFRAALDRVDTPGLSLADRTEALSALLGEARARDALSLLALSARLTPDERGAVFDRLSASSPGVDAALRHGFVAGEGVALSSLREALGVPVP